MTSYPSYDPTALFAGSGDYRARPVQLAQKPGFDATILNSGLYRRGTLLGRQAFATGPGAAPAAAAAGNAGNGTLTMDPAAPVLGMARPGIYEVLLTAAGTFQVIDPDGVQLAGGAVGKPYARQLAFQLAAGSTPFAAGDSFTVTVATADTYVPCLTAAVDGSQVPAVVLSGDVDTARGSAVGPAYFEGDFAFEIMIVDASWTYETLRAALRRMHSSVDVRTVGPAYG